MPWYYEENGAAAGPVENAQLVALAESGRIRLETRVTSDHGQTWVPLAQVANAVGLDAARLGTISAPATASCVSCRRTFALADLMQSGDQHVCADCKPLYLQRVKEGLSVAGQFRYGGFWIRFVARFVDGLLLFAVNMLFYLPFGVFGAAAGDDGALFGAMYCLTVLLQMAIGATYEIVMTKRYGATLGKMMLKLKVVQPDGSPLSWGRSTGRYFANLLSSLTLLIGYIIAAFDAEKRALHDHICSTRVVFGA